MSVDQYKKEIGMMNLEKLIQDREGISSKKFSIPDKELLFRYEQLYTGAVNDVMREFCLLEQALPGRIKSFCCRFCIYCQKCTERKDKG